MPRIRSALRGRLSAIFAAALVLPKCFLCVAGYFALGAELCGVPESSGPLAVEWSTLAGLVGVVLLAGHLLRRSLSGMQGVVR